MTGAEDEIHSILTDAVIEVNVVFSTVLASLFDSCTPSQNNLQVNRDPGYCSSLLSNRRKPKWLRYVLDCSSMAPCCKLMKSRPLNDVAFRCVFTEILVNVDVSHDSHLIFPFWKHYHVVLI